MAQPWRIDGYSCEDGSGFGASNSAPFTIFTDGTARSSTKLARSSMDVNVFGAGWF